MASITYWFPSDTNQSLFVSLLSVRDVEFTENHAFSEIEVIDPDEEVRQVAQDFGAMVREEKP